MIKNILVCRLISIFINLLLFIYPSLIMAQSVEDSAGQSIDIKTIQTSFFERYMKYRINQERVAGGFSELELNAVLKKASADQASYMSDIGVTEQSNPGDRAVAYGGTRLVTEIVGKASISSTKKTSYQQLFQLFMDKWKINPKVMATMLDNDMKYIGVSVSIDPIGEKLFAAIDFGNENSIAPVLNKSAAKYITTKTYGLQSFNAKTCSKCNKFPDINKLSEYVVLEDNNIYFVYDNLKKFKQLVKSPTDGLAIDLVNKNQYQCNRDNILNYKVPNKGILLKPIFSEELFASNSELPKSNRLKVKLGTLPKESNPDSLEINILVISQNTVCKNEYKTQLIIPEMAYEFQHSVSYLPVTDNSKTDYKKADKKSIDSIILNLNPPKTFIAEKAFNSVLAFVNNKYELVDVDYDKMTLLLDKLKQQETFKTDTNVALLELLLMKKFLDVPAISASIKDAAMNRIKATEPMKNIKLQLAMYQFFCNKGEYETALNWVDFPDIYEFFPHEVLFSCLSVTTLFPDKLNSKNYLILMEKASKADNVLFCSLFKKNALSIQILENQNIKRVYCESCK